MNDLLASDKNDLPFYSAFNCIPGVDHDQLVNELVSPWLASLLDDSKASIQVDGADVFDLTEVRVNRIESFSEAISYLLLLE